MNYRTLIVDDETAACERLERMLNQLDAPCDIIGRAMNGFEAITMINELKPDVVFLDIGLPGINGIELLRHCTFNPFIIFTTAYDNYAIEAFEAKTISYLIKPISDERLDAALKKLVTMTRVPAETLSEKLQQTQIPSTRSTLQLLPVKTGDNIILLKLETIIWIGAEGKYSVIATKDKKLVSSYSISELEERLNPSWFMRVHRSFIVNLKHVLELRKLGSGKWKIITTVPSTEDIIVSKTYYDLLKERLNID